ncbi:hypothetical protein EJB05_11292 [Eragrostis curvula]|uniref:GOST seven transmembrane domain-containing protein n=1 Tax=Eragrostis curvula TaxID=38414 RepID=A0A5J9VQZ5_9POAL|nr:hypothetical protein EJB05_11292 [Eragrostis curvula]
MSKSPLQLVFTPVLPLRFHHLLPLYFYPTQLRRSIDSVPASAPRARTGRSVLSCHAPRMTPMPMPSTRLAHLVVALLLSSCAAFLGADASVHEYAGERFTEYGNGFVLHGRQRGRLRLRIGRRVHPVREGGVQEDAGVGGRQPHGHGDGGHLRGRDRDTVGGTDAAGGRALCCTADMARLGRCTEGALALRRAPPNGTAGWPKVLAASFPPGGDGLQEAAFPDETVAVSRTGMYTLLFVHCDASLAGDQLAAQDDLEEQPRRVPARRMAPLLPFYGALSLAFAALASYWFAQYARHWRDVAPLQSLATLVIALGMTEAATWYFDLAELGESGLRPRGAAFWAATAGALRGAASRVLALLVARAHGVVRPCGRVRLGAGSPDLAPRFFVAAEALEVAENVGAVSDHSLAVAGEEDVPRAPRRGAERGVRLLDIQLPARRMTVKLEMYRKFTNALIIGVALSLGWITFEGHELLAMPRRVLVLNWHLSASTSSRRNEYNERWRAAWVIPAGWQLISFSLLCAVCLIWAPSHSSMRYAYSDEEGEECDLEDTRPLIRPGPLSYVDSWAISVSQDDTKVILRTDSGGVYAVKAGDGDKRV